MQDCNVIIAQNNPHSAQYLAASLHTHFRGVYIARNLDELRLCLRKRRPRAAVLDLELVNAPEIQSLRREFEQVEIVCTHRVPDEQIWQSALAAGAVDCCSDHDVSAIVAALDRGRTADGHAA